MTRRTNSLRACALLTLSRLLILLIRFTCLNLPPEADLFKSWWYDFGLYGVYPRQSFRSFPLRPPQLNFLQWDEQCNHGYTLLTPRGTLVWDPAPVILDARGEMIWMDDRFGEVMNMKVQDYKGEKYLTFWAGEFDISFGRGSYYMLDSSYQVYKQFVAAGVVEGDFHEYTITGQGTALLTVYSIAPADLSSLGIMAEGWIYDNVFQEIDIASGELLFEWRASDHYAVNETFKPFGSTGRTPSTAFDFFHINSADKDDSGNYYISSRFMHTITCISSMGKVLWVLGGRRNAFTDLSGGDATNFSWQHHANLHRNSTMTVFDNGKYQKWYQGGMGGGEYSRGLLLSLDTREMTVELLQEYVNPHMYGAPSQGSIQILPESENVLVGWGYHGAYTEYTHNGEMLCNIHITPSIIFDLGWVHSYRAFRTSTWIGKPTIPPAISYNAGDSKLYVSWNGATEVDHWVLQVADNAPSDELAFINASSSHQRHFETSIDVPKGSYQYLRVAAADKSGGILGHTAVVGREKGNTPSHKRRNLNIITLGLSCYTLVAWRMRRLLRRTGEAFVAIIGTYWRKSYSKAFGSRESGVGPHELESLYQD